MWQGNIVRVGATAAAAVLLSAVAVTPAQAKKEPKVWYVKATAGAGGPGSRRAPFDDLAAAQKASKPRQTIVVLPSTRALDGGIQLKPGQRLIGAGRAVGGRTKKRKRLPALQNTTDANLDGDAIRLAQSTTVRNIAVRTAHRGGIYGVDTVGVKIVGNDITQANTSCTNGFLVQPFNVPTGIPGVMVPASPAVAPQNGWASIMVDGEEAAGRIAIRRNRVHDSSCADGIDIRAMGTSQLVAKLARNKVTHLEEGDAGEGTGAVGSVLAIGMQALDQAKLHVSQNRNTQKFIGSEGADCEGQFANTASSGQIYETVNHNTFAHGIGGFSCNGFETIVSTGDGTIEVVLKNSTFRDNQGDMFEEGNLGAGSTMRFVARNVVVDGTHERGGNPPGSSDGGNNPVPFNIGDCMVAGHNGAGNSTTFVMKNSVFKNCNNGLSLLANVGQGNGSGASKELLADITGSVITGNAKYGIHVANDTPMDALHVKIAGTEISGNGGRGASFEIPTSALGSPTDVKLDLGGGDLGSSGGNCLFGNGAADVEANSLPVVADQNWWGQSGGPQPGQTATGGTGTISSSGGLSAKPSCGI
jgi:hypothetical protein